MTTTPLAHVQNGLAEIRATVAIEEAKIQSMQIKLGEALAAHRMGEKDAQKRAASLSMSLGKLRSNLEVLRSEERALSQRLEALTKADEEANRARQIEDAEAFMAEVQETEEAFAEAMRQCYTLTNRLHDMHQESQRHIQTLKGDLPDGFRVPRQPGRLFIWSAVQRGHAAIDRWLSADWPARPSATDVQGYPDPTPTKAPAKRRNQKMGGESFTIPQETVLSSRMMGGGE